MSNLTEHLTDAFDSIVADMATTVRAFWPDAVAIRLAEYGDTITADFYADRVRLANGDELDLEDYGTEQVDPNGDPFDHAEVFETLRQIVVDFTYVSAHVDAANLWESRGPAGFGGWIALPAPQPTPHTDTVPTLTGKARRRCLDALTVLTGMRRATAANLLDHPDTATSSQHTDLLTTALEYATSTPASPTIVARLAQQLLDDRDLSDEVTIYVSDDHVNIAARTGGDLANVRASSLDRDPLTAAEHLVEQAVAAAT